MKKPVSVQASDASRLVEGLCMYANAEPFCPYRVVIGGCPPWYDDHGLIVCDTEKIDADTVKVSFQLWGEKFVETRQPGWDWLCCFFRQPAPEAF